MFASVDAPANGGDFASEGSLTPLGVTGQMMPFPCDLPHAGIGVPFVVGANDRNRCEAGGLHPPYSGAVVAVRGINGSARRLACDTMTWRDHVVHFCTNARKTLRASGIIRTNPAQLNVFGGFPARGSDPQPVLESTDRGKQMSRAEEIEARRTLAPPGSRRIHCDVHYSEDHRMAPS